MSTNSRSQATSSGGIGFFGLLAILFIALKLTHYIDWSWWLVLSPLWIPFAAFCGILAIIGLVLALGALLGSK